MNEKEYYVNAYCSRVLSESGRLTRREADGLRAELSGHIEDHAEALTEHGYEEGAAYERAVTLMGDPEETGRALRAQYGGWWLVVVQRAARILTAVLCVMIAGLIVKSSGLYGAIRDRITVQKPSGSWEELWGSETPETRIAIGDDIVRIDAVSCGVPSAQKQLGEYQAVVELTGFDRIPGGVVYARLLESLRLENQRGEALFEGNEYAYPSSLSGSGTLWVHTARHYASIEPDDTYVTLVYDRFGERIETRIELPKGEVQP